MYNFIMHSLGLKKKMFVSCPPTVPKNGPDPSKTFFFILQKSP